MDTEAETLASGTFASEPFVVINVARRQTEEMSSTDRSINPFTRFESIVTSLLAFSFFFFFNVSHNGEGRQYVGLNATKMAVIQALDPE